MVEAGISSRLLGGATWRRLVAEVALIVAGVLIALAASAGWDYRRERKEEEGALRELRAALIADTADLHADLDRYQRVDRSARFLLDHLRNRRPYTPALDTLFSRQLTFRNHLSNSASYESLKSRGFGLIEDDSLRLSIIEFYSIVNADIGVWNNADIHLVEDAVRPYLRENFWLEPRTETEQRSAKPINYDMIAMDPRLHGLLANRIDGLSQTIPAYELAIQRAERLIHGIDRRIERLQ